jgi:hypothetical protein
LFGVLQAVLAVSKATQTPNAGHPIWGNKICNNFFGKFDTEPAKMRSCIDIAPGPAAGYRLYLDSFFSVLLNSSIFQTKLVYSNIGQIAV